MMRSTLLLVALMLLEGCGSREVVGTASQHATRATLPPHEPTAIPINITTLTDEHIDISINGDPPVTQCDFNEGVDQEVELEIRVIQIKHG